MDLFYKIMQTLLISGGSLVPVGVLLDLGFGRERLGILLGVFGAIVFVLSTIILGLVSVWSS